MYLIPRSQRCSPILPMLSCSSRASSIQEAAGIKGESPRLWGVCSHTGTSVSMLSVMDGLALTAVLTSWFRKTAAVKQQKCYLSPTPHNVPTARTQPSYLTLLVLIPTLYLGAPAGHQLHLPHSSSTYHIAVVPQATGRAQDTVLRLLSIAGTQ